MFHRSKGRQFFTQSIEQLESKRLLAVTATWTWDLTATSASLSIVGDNNANFIQIETDPLFGPNWGIIYTKADQSEWADIVIPLPGAPATMAHFATTQVASIFVDALGGIDTIDLRAVDAVYGFAAVYPLNDKITLLGGTGGDSIWGSSFDDSILGQDGADSIMGGPNNDTIAGGEGNDSIRGEGGDDLIWGESNGFAASITSANDWISGGPAADTIDGNFGDDRLFGDEVFPSWTPYEDPADGADSLYGGAASLSMVGGNDTLYGLGKKDTLNGGDGDDKLFGGSTGDWLDGWTGQDCVVGDSGSDTMFGGDNNDVMVGMEGCDLMYGEDGVDYLDGGFGDDNLTTGAGADAAYGGTGHDVIDGVGDNDQSEGCEPQMLMSGSPEIQAEKGVIAYRDQRIDIPFLEMLGREDRRVYLRYRGFTDKDIEVVEKLLEEFAVGRSGSPMRDGAVDAGPSEGFIPPVVASRKPKFENAQNTLRDERNDLVFLEMLGRADRRDHLRSRNFTHADIDVVEKLLEEFRSQRG